MRYVFEGRLVFDVPNLDEGWDKLIEYVSCCRDQFLNQDEDDADTDLKERTSDQLVVEGNMHFGREEAPAPVGMKICFHGTTAENAAKIKEEGFQEGTYFATHLEDSLEMGGPYIFEVAFDGEKVPDNWQFRVWEKIPPERIVELNRYDGEMLYENAKMRREVLDSNLTEEQREANRRIGV